MRRSRILALLLWASAAASDPPVTLVDGSRADFVRGRFEDGGAGFYVSARGRVEQIHRLDSADSPAALRDAPWQGPAGPDSAYRDSNAAVKGIAGPWIQYRAVFRSTYGVVYPVLTNVSISLSPPGDRRIR